MGWINVCIHLYVFINSPSFIYAVSMLSQVTFNREKWINAVLLDSETGLDPPGVRVRAAQGSPLHILLSLYPSRLH